MPRHPDTSCTACQRPMAKTKMKSDGGSGLRCKAPHGCAAPDAAPAAAGEAETVEAWRFRLANAGLSTGMAPSAKTDAGETRAEKSKRPRAKSAPASAHVTEEVLRWLLNRPEEEAFTLEEIQAGTGLPVTANDLNRLFVGGRIGGVREPGGPDKYRAGSHERSKAAADPTPAPGSYAIAAGRINRKGKPVDETERCDICGCAGGCDRGGGSVCCWTRPDGEPGPQRCLACAELLDTAREALETDDLDGAALAKRLHDSTDMPCADDARIGKIVAIAIAEEKGAEAPVEVRGGDTRPAPGTRVRITKGSRAGRTGTVNRLCKAPFADRLYVDLDPAGRERTKKSEQIGADEVEPIVGETAVEPPPPSDAPPPRPVPPTPKPAPAPVQPPLPGLGAARELTLPFPKPLPSEQNAAAVMTWLRAQPPDATFSVDEVAAGAAVLPARAFDAIETLVAAGRVEAGGDEAPTRYRAHPSERPAAPNAPAVQRCSTCGDVLMPGGPWAALPGGRRVCGKQACAAREAQPAPTAADRRDNVEAAIRGVIDTCAAFPDSPLPTEAGLVRDVADGLPSDVPREQLEVEVANVIGAMFERGELVQITPSKPGQGTTPYFRRKGGPPAPDLRDLVGAAPTRCERDPNCGSQPGHGGHCIPRPTVSRQDVERAPRSAGMPPVMAAVLADVVTHGHDPGAVADAGLDDGPELPAVLGGPLPPEPDVDTAVREALDLDADEEQTPLAVALDTCRDIETLLGMLRNALRQAAGPPQPAADPALAQLRATLALVEQQRDEALAALAAKTSALEAERQAHGETERRRADAQTSADQIMAGKMNAEAASAALATACEHVIETLGAARPADDSVLSLSSAVRAAVEKRWTDARIEALVDVVDKLGGNAPALIDSQPTDEQALAAVLEHVRQSGEETERMRRACIDAAVLLGIEVAADDVPAVVRVTMRTAAEKVAGRIGALRAGIIETAGKLGRETEPLLGLPDEALVAEVLAAAATARRPLRVPRIEEPAPVVPLDPAPGSPAEVSPPTVPGCPF